MTKNYIGIDIGDKNNAICVLDFEGNVQLEVFISNNIEEMTEFFLPFTNTKIAIEACSHSLWINNLLQTLGHEVLVGNPRKMYFIHKNEKKCDKADALSIARQLRSDPKLLYPVTTRDFESQQDLIFIKAREMLVRSRGDLVRSVRGLVKPFGIKLPDEVTCANFHNTAPDHIDPVILKPLKYMLRSIKKLDIEIKSLDKKIKLLIKKKYLDATLLQTIDGIGPISALTYVLIIGEPKRFNKSRKVGAYFGMTPKRDQSGEIDKALPITKCGDVRMRTLLVNCAQHILGPFGKDSQVRQFGLKIMGDGSNKIRKRKAVVAVARKLSVIMHSMMMSQKQFKNTIA